MPDDSLSENPLQAASPGPLPTFLPLVGAGFAAVVLFCLLSGPEAWIPAIATAIMDLATVGLVLISAGGWGRLILARIAPTNTGKLFYAVSASAIGLWMFSTAMLVAGTFIGIPAAWVCWSVVGLGVVLAAFAARKANPAFRLPRRVGWGSLGWIVLGACVGVWLAGAVRPPGFIGGADAYDVLEYHLQVPREFFEGGGVTSLRHNVYSYYPLGLEMLFLLGMCLRGGAYAGVYLCKVMHGAFALLAVAGVISALRAGPGKRSGGLFGGALLASTPAVLYLSWLALVELAMICYLALAVLWLRYWLRGEAGESWRACACVGLMLGAACSMKYLSVAFVAGPVLVVMLVAAMAGRNRLRHVALAAVIAGAVFSPWLIRNAVYTGNAVFPLGTSVFGRGHWTPQEANRWRSGHGPQQRPPVPTPPGWVAPPPEDRLQLFWKNFPANPLFGWGVMAIAAVTFCWLPAGPDSLSAKRWEWALVGILLIQVAVWATVTHGLPWRFLAPAAVPIALLAGVGLNRLAGAKIRIVGKWDGWGRGLALVVFLVAAGWNVYVGVVTYEDEIRGMRDIPPWPAEKIAREITPVANLPFGSRVMLVGEARAFYFPPGTIYATPFDRHPLAELAAEPIDDVQRMKRLRAAGVTHILVNWSEIRRLARTYGYPASLSEGLAERHSSGRAPTLGVLEGLKRAGMKEVHSEYGGQAYGTPRPRTPTIRRAWPVFTLYALPAAAR